MIGILPHETQGAVSRDEDIGSKYAWCLNPFRRMKDLFDYLRTELLRYDSITKSWEQEESRVNIYLFACAVSCTVDDYISWKPWVLTSLIDIYPRLSLPIRAAERFLNLPHAWASRRGRGGAARWKAGWDEFVELACRFLIENPEMAADGTASLKRRFEQLAHEPLPPELLARRMRLNEGFRCQDLTHHDALKLAERYLQTSTEKDHKVIIVGSRTAGSYFAPLIKVYLEANGLRDVAWMTLRPKTGISGWERRKLLEGLKGNSRVLLTDDYSNTGLTFRLLQGVLGELGVSPDRITILAPIHPAKPEGNLSSSNLTKVITIDQTELYKARQLEPANIVTMLSDVYSDREVDEISVIADRSLAEINESLSGHYCETFQARLKKVFLVKLKYLDGNEETRRILAKSVGWGWLGYHALISGERLNGFVPEIFGLRNGILFMEWVDGVPLSQCPMSVDVLRRMSAYLAERALQLRLDEDPRLDRSSIGWGWLQALRILRRAYGNTLGYMKNEAILKRLREATHPVPVFTDGRMRPEEWIVSGERLVKVDFEHHNFGAPEFDVVDPAYDLAITSFEFRLSPEEEESLVENYAKKTGDSTIRDRLILYKLVYGEIEGDRTNYRLVHRKDIVAGPDLNRRNLWSWNFRVYSMNRFCAGMLQHDTQQRRDDKYFFMDLDGVFDREVLGFAHTTPSALLALTLLKSSGYSVIPNTGRSIGHIINYCRAYAFDGAIGEYGSVLYDRLTGTETDLRDEPTSEELVRLRKEIEGIDGMFCDPTYRYALRVYRHKTRATAGLGREQAEELMSRADVKSLRAITREADTYFVGKSNDKGNAIESFGQLLGSPGGYRVAIGDSDEDIPMLRRVKKAYAPSNCTKAIKALGKESKWRVVPRGHQRGLLTAVREEIGGNVLNIPALDWGGEGTVHRLLANLLSISEGSRTERMFALVRGVSHYRAPGMGRMAPSGTQKTELVQPTKNT